MRILLAFCFFACAVPELANGRPRNKVCNPGTCTSWITEYDRLDAIIDELGKEHTDVWTCDEFSIGSDPLDACEWNIVNPGWGQENVAGVSDPAGNLGNALRVFYPNGSYAGHPDQENMRGGAQFYHVGFGLHRELNLEYDLYFSNCDFSDNFDFVIGGKLPGFYGGEGQCAGGQYNDCFSIRFMWRENGQVEIYSYLPVDECDWYCDEGICPLNICNFDFGHSFGRGAAVFTQGKWHRLRQFLRMNDVGSSNGLIRYYLDGELRFEITGITFRKSEEVFPDHLYFSTFFGGSTIPDYASKQDCYTYYRNFRIFT